MLLVLSPDVLITVKEIDKIEPICFPVCTVTLLRNLKPIKEIDV